MTAGSLYNSVLIRSNMSVKIKWSLSDWYQDLAEWLMKHYPHVWEEYLLTEEEE